MVRHVAFAVVRQFVHFEHFTLGKQVAAEGVSHAELRITAPCHLKHIVAQTPERTAAVGQPAHYHLVANLQFIRQARFAEKHFALRCNRMSPFYRNTPPGVQKSAKSSKPKKLAITFSVFLLGLLSWSWIYPHMRLSVVVLIYSWHSASSSSLRYAKSWLRFILSPVLSSKACSSLSFILAKIQCLYGLQ